MHKYIEETLPEQVEELRTLLRIPSVKEPPLPNKPFGAPMYDALSFTLALAEKLGLKSRNIDGYAGVVEYGEGEETLGILCHLDVVPVGAGWTYPPFGAMLDNGRIYARGAIDDKGPALSALYALAAIKNSGMPLKRKVRIIFGCDEESGWACMDYYKEHEPLPDIAFSPDAEYPLVYSEKGILGLRFEKKYASGISFTCGTRPNVVPGEAEAWVPFETSEPEDMDEGFGVLCDPEAGGTRITVTGRGGHAAFPWSAKNALQELLIVLDNMPLTGEDAETVHVLARALSDDVHGEHLGIDCEDESGRLTCNAGILHWDENGLSITFDLRLPLSADADEITKKVEKALAPAGLTLAGKRLTAGHRVDPESELVRKLLAVYSASTGKEAKPLAIGGGTYARALPGRAVAFGCEPEDEPSRAHMPDEYIRIDEIAFNTRVMADAIAALCLE